MRVEDFHLQVVQHARHTKPLAPRAWKSKNDFHFPPATATAGNLRLHFKCLEDHGYGYILKWLDRELRDSPIAQVETALSGTSVRSFQN